MPSAPATPKVEPTKPAAPATPAPPTVATATEPLLKATALPNGVDMHDVEAQAGPVLTNDPTFAANFMATTKPPATLIQNPPANAAGPESITPKVTVTMPDLTMPAMILGGMLCGGLPPG